MTGLRLVTASVEATRALGRRLGDLLAAGDVVLLHGDLGAGKTTLSQGIVAAGRPGVAVQSPTFTLINEYPPTANQPALFHVDLYRLDGPDDLETIGLDDLLATGAGVVLIEWPERLGEDLPEDYLLVQIEPAGPDTRQIEFRAVPENGRHGRIIEALVAASFRCGNGDGLPSA